MKKFLLLSIITITAFYGCESKSDAELFADEVYAALNAENYTTLTLLIDKNIRESNQSKSLLRTFISYNQSFDNFISRDLINTEIEKNESGDKMILEYKTEYKNKIVFEKLTVKTRVDGYKIYGFEYEVK